MTEPELIKAGDERVLINGRTIPVDYRIVWEDNYQKLKKAFDLPIVIDTFSQNDMENFAAKCMLNGANGKLMSELLQDFCDNDL